ncbi:Transcriptional regulator, PadR family [[Actinomadura] parvosata subsp. kistnae]|uniref:PadR family transcriptional regulator n=2 Tax=Nonomuraea TaxID=83681 RepID=A0A1U9ZUB0_9ACTN|nr:MULTISPECIES: PadR family transcriptional regulator [unclassified Nonomuraea]AQZ61543.1 PadR family transcriptional regulator [Nonomuraea sp. ATCC 55076]NJP88597.1 PadR family transcriptional regulator [Nonomuraea sp. FMUSA5-5]SPL98262.1 Transcriptional regulator, PadR family [Actinomadura parvosata subsp. kistnae]
MPRRRPVSNLLALAVLTVVTQRPMHPYEMASVLRARGKDQDMPIKWGSLYTVVRNLEKHGLLEAVESGRQGARPERTVYRVTDAGRREADDWTRELLAEPRREPSAFEAGLSVMGGLGPDEVASLLRRRLELLEERIEADRRELEAHRAEVPRLFLVESEYALALLEAQAAWVASVLAELDGGTFPGQEEWRTYHQSGEMSPDVAALAERGRPEEGE